MDWEEACVRVYIPLRDWLALVISALKGPDTDFPLAPVARMEQRSLLAEAGQPGLRKDVRDLAGRLVFYKRVTWNLRERVTARFDALMQEQGRYRPGRREYLFLRNGVFQALTEDEDSYWLHYYDQHIDALASGRWETGYLRSEPVAAAAARTVYAALYEPFAAEIGFLDGFRRVLRVGAQEVKAALEPLLRSPSSTYRPVFSVSAGPQLEKMEGSLPPGTRSRIRRWGRESPPRGRLRVARAPLPRRTGAL